MSHPSTGLGPGVFLALVLPLLGSCSLVAEEDFPPLARTGSGPLLSAGLIYDLENRPTPQCHASTIVETGSGLVAAWFGGRHEKSADVGIWVSRHDGKNWGRPVRVASGAEGEDREYPCWNPVLFKPEVSGDRSGEDPLLLFYKVGPSPNKWWGMMMTSRDDGRTWEHRHKLGKDARIGHLLGPVKNKPIQLKDGSILCGSSSEHAGWRVHFERTTDLGRTWEVIGPIHDGRDFGAIQPSILRYADGRLQILCRSRQGVIAQSWSGDEGRTWSRMKATELPNPSAGTDAVTLRDGRQLLVYNHTTKRSKPRSREMLNVAITGDGEHWEVVMTLERREGEFSYPAVIQSRDGMVHITYTYLRRSVKHVVLDPAKLKRSGS